MDVLKDLFDKGNLAILAGAALSVLFSKLSDSAEEKRSVDAKAVQNCDIKSADELLSSDVTPSDYVGIQGYVATADQPLSSEFSDSKGVYIRSSTVEHSSQRSNGIWSDHTKTIKYNTNNIPFGIAAEKGQVAQSTEQIVSFEKLKEASHWEECLTVTYDKFTPVQHSLLRHGLDRVFGEHTKGYQDTEKMLILGTPILAVGELSIADGRRMLRPSLSGPFVLTRLSRDELVSSLQSSSRWFRVLKYLFTGVTAALFVWMSYRIYKKLEHKWLMRRLREEVQRGQANREDRGESAVSTCVICLDKESSLFMMNCGHLCCCIDCFELLPTPKLCPVCRSSVVRAQPIYIS